MTQDQTSKGARQTAVVETAERHGVRSGRLQATATFRGVRLGPNQERGLGIRLADVRDEVEACLAESRIAAMLRVRAGTPLLRITRLFVSAADECVDLTRLIIRDEYRASGSLDEQPFA